MVPAFAGAVVLMVLVRDDPLRLATVAIYGAALVLLFGVSALYHTVGWRTSHRRAWRRADHATIFLMIAGTYTPIVTTLLDGWWRIALLAAVWSAAIAGASLTVAPLRLPRPVFVSLYLAIGWLALIITPMLYARLGPGLLAMLVAGGLLYSAGATMYALQRPRLWPRVFGYHEVFHLLVIAASAVFFIFISLTVVPAARA
jgi:hemolysin III